MATSASAGLSGDPYTFGSLRIRPSLFREEIGDDSLVLLPEEWNFTDSVLTRTSTPTQAVKSSPWGIKSTFNRPSKRKGFVQKLPLESTTCCSHFSLNSVLVLSFTFLTYLLTEILANFTPKPRPAFLHPRGLHNSDRKCFLNTVRFSTLLLAVFLLIH